MEEAPDIFVLWLQQYGNFALFGLLALGIIALPIPDETLMVAAGILIDRGDLQLIPTMLAAYLGSICGITVSYMLGATAGTYLIKKYGKQLGLTEARLLKVHNWFERYGKWVLFFGYFIPSVRHLSGLFAGMSGLNYFSFALFAYTGAIVWASTFLFIGYFIGQNWILLFEHVEEYSEILIMIGVLALIAAFFYFRFKNKRNTPAQ